MTTLDDLGFDLARRPALPHRAQVGRAIASNAKNCVAAFAARCLKDRCAPLPRFRSR